jgi:hypothetical protein
MTDDRLKTESAGRLGRDCREVARRAGVEVGGVRACRSIILAEPGAAGFAGIAAFRSLLPKEADFGVSATRPWALRWGLFLISSIAPGAIWRSSLGSHSRSKSQSALVLTTPTIEAPEGCTTISCRKATGHRRGLQLPLSQKLAASRKMLSRSASALPSA